jgi:hypothetical protein
MMTFINNTSKPIDIGDVQTISSKTVKIPFAGWSNRSDITINTTASGADVPVDVYKFPILIRLSESNFDFSLAKGDGADCRFSKLSNIPLTHSVEMWDSLQKKASIWVLMDTIHGNSVQSISMLYGNSGAGTPAKSPDVFDTADGFLGNYHFNGNLKDATVNKYNGVDSGTIDSPDGIIGKARGFDGLKSFFQLKNLPDRPTGTISFWYRPAHKIDTSLAVTQGIWGKAVNDSINFTMSFIGKDYYIGPGLNSTGSLTTKIENADTGFYLISKTNTFVKNNWYHVAWCWGKNKNLLYINGILENSNPDSRSVSGGGNDEIGRSPYDVSNIQYGIPRYFNGSLDEFRIEKAVRNEYWIKLSFMNQSENDKLVSIKK